MRPFLSSVGLLAMSSCVSAGDPYHVNITSGPFEIESVTMHAPDTNDTWHERTVAHVELAGTAHKIVKAGTLQYQIFEHGVTGHIASGSFSYFHCTNQGCDPTQPMALNLTSPFNSTSDLTLIMQFQMPYSDPGADLHDYQIVLWGSDQDHTPYDFSATIDYNTTSGHSKTHGK